MTADQNQRPSAKPRVGFLVALSGTARADEHLFGYRLKVGFNF